MAGESGSSLKEGEDDVAAGECVVLEFIRHYPSLWRCVLGFVELAVYWPEGCAENRESRSQVIPGTAEITIIRFAFTLLDFRRLP